VTGRPIVDPGTIVTVTVALVTVYFAYITGQLYLDGEIEAAKDAGILLGGFVTGLTALLAKTRRDPVPEPGQTTVTTDVGTPVTAGPAPAAGTDRYAEVAVTPDRGTPDSRDRDWLRPSGDLL
jgi:hypothetical protein